MAKNEETVHRGMFATREEAQAAIPEGTKMRVFAVGHDGTTRFTVAGNNEGALANAAKADGYVANAAGKPATREEAEAVLSRLSPEDLSILIRQHAPKGKK